MSKLPLKLRPTYLPVVVTVLLRVYHLALAMLLSTASSKLYKHKCANCRIFKPKVVPGISAAKRA